MKNKIFIIFAIVLSFGFVISVNAASSPATCEHDINSTCDTSNDIVVGDYSNKKSLYDKGITKNNISGSTVITLYGKSLCNGTSCEISYSGGVSLASAISKSVVCTNGEKNVTYTLAASGKEDYTENNPKKLTGTAYWDEDYLVTCTSSSTSDTGQPIVSIDKNSSGSDSATDNGTSNSGTSNSGTSNSGTSNGGTSNGGYSSSTTTDNSQTGVSTYFVVLGLIAIISYVCMIFVKKFDLFKSI